MKLKRENNKVLIDTYASFLSFLSLLSLPCPPSLLSPMSSFLSYLAQGDISHVVSIKILVAGFNYNTTRLQEKNNNLLLLLLLILRDKIRHTSPGGGLSFPY